MTPNSQVSRADLLRALQTCQKKTQADPQALAAVAELFGYEIAEQQRLSISELDQETAIEAGDVKAVQQGTPRLNSPSAQAQVTYYYVAHRERYASESSAKQEQPDCLQGVEAIGDDALDTAWDKQAAITPSKLTQAARMTPRIRQGLRQVVGQRLDVKALVKQVARQTPLKQLPTQPRWLPAGRVTVIADFNQRLVPFWEDIHEACELIQQKHGKIGLDIRVLAKDEPLQAYYAYAQWRQQQLQPKPWEKIPAQSLVFILSDLGQLAPENSLIRHRWLSFVQQLNRRGIKPVVLAPIAAEQQSHVLQKGTQQLLWQRFGTLKIQQSCGDQLAHQAHVLRVVSFLSLSPHIEPELLRTLCELLPFQQGNTGIEAEVYLHPDVQFGLTSIAIKPSQREHYQQQFKQLPVALKQQVFDCIQQHHSAQFAAVWAESILNAEPLMPVKAALVKQAEALMLRLAKRYYNQPTHDGMMRFARRHLSRINTQQQHKKPYASALYGLAYRAAIEQGKAIPKHLDSSIVNQVIRQSSEVTQYQLYQIGEHCFICAMDDKRLQQRGLVGQVLARFSTVQTTLLINQQSLSLPIEQYPLRNDLQIDTGQEYLTIRALKKPSWASTMTLQDGYPRASLMLAGQRYDLVLKASETRHAMHDWDFAHGGPEVDHDELGLYADIPLSGVVQRFRYIEPGSFIMGSPEDEQGRFGDETPHQATLTQGYWMADTACTQELWQAVMGKNPAHFQENLQNPVENVSWLEIQRFIARIKQQLPELMIQLPSEAQWEYACRAGTSSAFSFEGEISLDPVNYRGLWELENDKNGDYKWHSDAKQKTVPVKSLPANPWGLYEMHGNVWEWCFDEWEQNLGREAVVNPVQGQFKSGVKPDTVLDSRMLENGDDTSVERVLRGGSWNGIGRYCRSAIRLRNDADNRNVNMGFRLSLGLELLHRAVSRSDRANASEQTAL